MFSWLFKKKDTDHPIPGEDAHWLGFCPKCQDQTSFASRGGFKNGGVEHCYDCGNEKETRGFREKDIDQMKISSWCHWQKYSLIPYDWHTLTESERWKILGMNGNISRAI